jgi:hypothetical protein
MVPYIPYEILERCSMYTMKKLRMQFTNRQGVQYTHYCQKMSAKADVIEVQSEPGLK